MCVRVCMCVCVRVRVRGLKMYHFGSLLGLIWRPHNDQFSVHFGRVEQLTPLLFALHVCFGSDFSMQNSMLLCDFGVLARRLQQAKNKLKN